MKKIILEILRFRSEYFITPLFITLFILSIIYIGLGSIKNIIFNLLLFIEIPLIFWGVRYVRKMLYYVWKEDLKDEN